MSIKKAIYNDTIKTFTIAEPVRKFFVKHNKFIIPNTNYYFCLFICGQLISFTNKFNNYHELYELDLFVENIILPMDILFEDNKSIVVRSIILDLNNNINYLDEITELYYESFNGYNLVAETYNIFFPEDDSFIPKLVYENIFNFHDSPLADYFRLKNDGSFFKQFYETKIDNVIRYINGKCYSAHNNLLFNNLSNL